MAYRKPTLALAASLVLLLSVLLAGCDSEDAQEGTSGSKEQSTDKKTVEIGLFNWAENVAVSNMWKLLLEERGYEVNLTTGDKSPVWTGVAKGDMDLHFEAWLPRTDKPLWEEYSDTLERYGPWYEGTALGLAVPADAPIDSIEELNAHRDTFEYNGEPSIVGIDSGASIMKLTEEAVDTYDLNYKLIASSGPVMSTSVIDAVEHNENIVATLWKPHWIFSRADLKFLEDPKNIYGKNENIYLVTYQDFDETHPQVLSWMQNWKMDDQSLGSLMATINNANGPEEGAREWIEEKRDLVDSWFE